jgi:thiol-disulfide isomerase/thioredoxin
MKRTSVLFLLLLVLIVGALIALAYWYTSIPKDAWNADATTVLNEVKKGTYINLQGNEVSFSNNVGKVRVITSWASWNPFSTEDLKVLNAVAGHYKDRDVSFVALNRKETKEQAERFLKDLTSLENFEIAIDTEDVFYNSVGGYAMPETVIYDAKGNIRVHHRGILSESQLREMVESVLNLNL